MKLRFFELSSLVRWEHSKGCANFHAHSADLTNHLKNSFKTSFSTSKIPPSSTHTETCASVFLCFPSSFQNRFKIDKLWSRRWSRILRRLRAVRTYDPISLRLIHLEEDWFATNNLRCILQLQGKYKYIRIKDIIFWETDFWCSWECIAEFCPGYGAVYAPRQTERQGQVMVCRISLESPPSASCGG